jgi:hypothetical protein
MISQPACGRKPACLHTLRRIIAPHKTTQPQLVESNRRPKFANATQAASGSWSLRFAVVESTATDGFRRRLAQLIETAETFYTVWG